MRQPGGPQGEVPHGQLVRDLAAARRGAGELAPVWMAPGPLGRASRADLTQQALEALWEQAADGEGAAGLALGVVGSLGRCDPGPMSDLDVVVLHDGKTHPADRIAQVAERMWYPIWDLGFDLDHSVRSLAQCRKVASDDVPAAVGLLSLRTVAGDAELGAAAAAAVLSDWRAASRRRLPDLLGEIARRAERSGEVAYLIEPDLKEARGGLRDAVSLDALTATWLADRPHGGLDAARAWLLDVRDALHAATRRHTHKLLMAYQDEVADALGLAGADDLLARIAEAARTIAYALDVTVRHARQAAERKPVARPFVVRGRRMAPQLPTLAPGLVRHDGQIVLAAGTGPSGDRLLALRAASLAATHGLPIAPMTVSHLACAPPLPPVWPTEAVRLLLDLLGAGQRLPELWESLDQARIPEAWFVEWTEVRNRPQRTVIHRHTVDRHLIETVAIAATLDLPGADLPMAPNPATGRLAPDGDAVAGPEVHDVGGWPEPASGDGLVLTQRQMLLIAALFHDIGKRPGVSDHAADGARRIGPICARLGLSTAAAADVELLVREHLTLADLATKHDIEDPATAAALAEAVAHRPDLLDLLRALTEADARAAGPAAWTPWRANLIDRLTAQTARALGS